VVHDKDADDNTTTTTTTTTTTRHVAAVIAHLTDRKRQRYCPKASFNRFYTEKQSENNDIYIFH
jgi:hypothetical protein